MAQINKPSDYFNTKLYSGTDSAQSVTGVGFQPDWTWIKCRSHGGSGSFNHVLNDVVRGVGEVLVSNSNSAANSSYDYGSLASFDNDGFTTVAGGTSIDGVGGAGRTYASWNWLADNTSGSSNTDGSISSTVSANTTSGFSIVKYTGNASSGATIGHGLGTAPKMIFFKNLSIASNWIVYNNSMSANGDYVLFLDSASAKDNSQDYLADTAPTSSVFSVGARQEANGSGNSQIAYCFADVKGYSKFGSYTGNGNADGPFSFCGFKPAYVLVKDASSSNNWRLSDNKRNEFNLVDDFLFPSSNIAENAISGSFDFLSNGFKARSSNGGMNTSGSTYIYMAIAEEPLVGTNNIPATAR